MPVTITYDGATPTVGGDEDTWGTELNVGALAKIKVDLDALATQGNATETDSDAATAALAALTALTATYTHTGDVKFILASSAPTGWVKADGGSIGSAASGGTTRANADTAALFAVLWNLNVLDSAIQDSTGAGSTKGASAAADFAANKRMVLPDMRANFPRAWDDSRGIDTARRLGSYAADKVALPGDLVGTFGGAGGLEEGGGAPNFQIVSGGSATETAPKSIALLAVVKL